MRKFLFSFLSVLAITGLIGLQSAFSQSCPAPTESFDCSGGFFYGTQQEIHCWMNQLNDGICALSDCDTVCDFYNIELDIVVTFYLGCNPE